MAAVIGMTMESMATFRKDRHDLALIREAAEKYGVAIDEDGYAIVAHSNDLLSFVDFLAEVSRREREAALEDIPQVGGDNDAGDDAE